jgi:hypothetical protein
MPTELRAKRKTRAWSWPAKATGDSDLIATVLFCIIVLLGMLVLMVSFPDFWGPH